MMGYWLENVVISLGRLRVAPWYFTTIPDLGRLLSTHGTLSKGLRYLFYLNQKKRGYIFDLKIPTADLKTTFYNHVFSSS
jgi:hypothetical protein